MKHRKHSRRFWGLHLRYGTRAGAGWNTALRYPRRHTTAKANAFLCLSDGVPCCCLVCQVGKGGLNVYVSYRARRPAGRRLSLWEVLRARVRSRPAHHARVRHGRWRELCSHEALEERAYRVAEHRGHRPSARPYPGHPVRPYRVRAHPHRMRSGRRRPRLFQRHAQRSQQRRADARSHEALYGQRRVPGVQRVRVPAHVPGGRRVHLHAGRHARRFGVRLHHVVHRCPDRSAGAVVGACSSAGHLCDHSSVLPGGDAVPHR